MSVSLLALSPMTYLERLRKSGLSISIISLLLSSPSGFGKNLVITCAETILDMPVKKQSKAVKKTPPYHKDTGQAVKEKKEKAAKVTTDNIEIEVSASDNTWIQVIGDGELMFTGAVKKGAKETWKAKKEIKLEAGDSGVIKINVNGKSASFSGKRGEKKEIIITKDGIKN